MGYRAGIGENMKALGLTPCEPHVFCDGCGATRAIGTRTAYAAQWFLSYRPPPGWKGCRMHDGSKRWDLCPRCWKGPSAPDGGSDET